MFRTKAPEVLRKMADELAGLATELRPEESGLEPGGSKTRTGLFLRVCRLSHMKLLSHNQALSPTLVAWPCLLIQSQAFRAAARVKAAMNLHKYSSR